MTETERRNELLRRFELVLRKDLSSMEMMRSKPRIVVCAEDVEGKMERPGIDTKPFAYHIVNGRARAGRQRWW